MQATCDIPDAQATCSHAAPISGGGVTGSWMGWGTLSSTNNSNMSRDPAQRIWRYIPCGWNSSAVCSASPGYGSSPSSIGAVRFPAPGSKASLRVMLSESCKELNGTLDMETCPVAHLSDNCTAALDSGTGLTGRMIGRKRLATMSMRLSVWLCRGLVYSDDTALSCMLYHCVQKHYWITVS